MHCPKCQIENPSNRRFCRECGAKLILACPNCQFENIPSDKFCGDCGHDLTQPFTAPPTDLSFDEKIAKITDDSDREMFRKQWAKTQKYYEGPKKKGKDGGLDGEALMSDYKNDSSTIELRPVYFSVKSDLKPHVSYIRQLHSVIERDKAAFGIFISLYEPTKDMVEECKNLGYYQCKIIDKKYIGK